jgi:hypothetical protein
MTSGAHLLPGFDQPFMDRIELVGTGGDDLPLDRLLEPCPLKDRRLEDRGRCIGVILQQFRRTPPVETEIEPAIEAAVVAAPTVADQRPECFRYLQTLQIAFVADRAADEFEAHRIDFARGILDLTFDFIQREGVIGALVPIALAVKGMKVKSGCFGGGAPVVAFGA